MADKPIAYDAYQQLADDYARNIDSKPHNAFYDRPAMLSLLPDVQGWRVLDVGCGPGAYTEALLERGAVVTAVDISPKMLEHAKRRVGERAKFLQLDLTQPMEPFFSDGTFDLINAPLCLDYIEDWRTLFRQFHRVLDTAGLFLFSCGHPAFDAEYFRTEQYFSVEPASSVWTGFGNPVEVPCYRRSMEEVIMPVLDSGFRLIRLHEPLPTEQFRKADPVRYQRLMHRPGFLCVVAQKV